MPDVRVELEDRSYDIQIGQGNLAEIVDFVQERRPTSHVVVITDTNVDPLYGDKVADLFGRDALHPVQITKRDKDIIEFQRFDIGQRVGAVAICHAVLNRDVIRIDIG